MDKNEKELLSSYEKGEWQRVKNFENKKKNYTEYAKNTLRKDKRLNIRISSKDLEGIQRAAVREGIVTANERGKRELWTKGAKIR